MNSLEIMFTRGKTKPKVRFHSLVHAVKTLYPIIPSSKLKRSWQEPEQQEYKEKFSKCPFAFILDTGEQIPHRSVGKCPSVNSLLASGYVVTAPADFKVHIVNGQMQIQCGQIMPGYEYVGFHDSDHGKWLKDSTKDACMDEVIKVNTPWRVTSSDPDIIFLQLKVPFLQEERFTAITGILDPRHAYEINPQLWWHSTDDGITTIEAGTPLAMYLPISRKLLGPDVEILVEDADEIDLRMESEMRYAGNHKFVELDTLTSRVKRLFKILQKYHALKY